MLVAIESLPDLDHPVPATVHEIITRRAPIVTLGHRPHPGLRAVACSPSRSTTATSAGRSSANGVPVLLRTPPAGRHRQPVLQRPRLPRAADRHRPAPSPTGGSSSPAARSSAPTRACTPRSASRPTPTSRRRSRPTRALKAGRANYDAVLYDWAGSASRRTSSPGPPTTSDADPPAPSSSARCATATSSPPRSTSSAPGDADADAVTVPVEAGIGDDRPHRPEPPLGQHPDPVVAAGRLRPRRRRPRPPARRLRPRPARPALRRRLDRADAPRPPAGRVRELGDPGGVRAASSWPTATPRSATSPSPRPTPRWGRPRTAPPSRSSRQVFGSVDRLPHPVHAGRRRSATSPGRPSAPRRCRSWSSPTAPRPTSTPTATSSSPRSRRTPTRSCGRSTPATPASWSTPGRAWTAPASTTASSSRARPQADLPPVSALATFNDPARPIRWGGPFGHVAILADSTTVTTAAEAQAAADALLRLRLKQTRSLELTARPEPGAGGRRHDQRRVPRRPRRDPPHRRRHDRPRDRRAERSSPAPSSRPTASRGPPSCAGAGGGA